MLAGFLPHAHNNPTAKGGQTGNDGKPHCQADVQLAQNQPACVSLPYAIRCDGVFHVRLTLWARGRPYMASGVWTPSNCKPLRNTVRTAAVRVRRVAVKARASGWRMRTVRSLFQRVQSLLKSA